MIDLELLQRAVMDSRDGISIADATDPEMPLVFVNPAFERMTGYSYDEVVGRNCRFLQRDDRDETLLQHLRDGFVSGQGCSVMLRNYRRNGSVFWNELSLSPIHDENGEVTHFFGVQKDVTGRVRIERQLQIEHNTLKSAKAVLEKMVVLDELTGIYNRRHFDSRLDMLWKVAARNANPLALFFIDIDYFKQYNDALGHSAGDRALIAVANALAECFQRGSDFLARYGGEEFVVLASGMTYELAASFAEELCAHVRELNIAHPATSGGRLTISVGYAAVTPCAGMTAAETLERADQALFAAKAHGRDHAEGAAELEIDA